MTDFDSDQAEIDAMSMGGGLNAISGINGDNVSNTDLNNNIGGLRSSVNILSQNIASFSKTVISASKQLGEGVNNQLQFDPKTYMIRNSLAASGPIGAIITKAIQDSGLGIQIGEGIKSKIGGLFSRREKYDSQSGYLSPHLMTQSVTDSNALVVKELHQNVAAQLIEANEIAKQELNESKKGNESIVSAIGRLENSTLSGQNKVTGAGSSTSNNVVTAIATLQSALLNALKDIQLSISGGQNGRTGQVHSGISNVNNNYNQGGGGGSVDNSDVVNAIGQLGSKLQEAPEGKMSGITDMVLTATKVGTLFRGKYVNDIRKTGNPLTTQVSALLEIYRWQRLYGELTKKQFNEIIRLLGGEQKDVVGKHGLLKETFLRNKDAIKRRMGRLGWAADFAMFDMDDIDDKARASMAYGLNKSLQENSDDNGLITETLASLPLIGRIAKNRLHNAGKQTMYDYANEIHNTDGGVTALLGSDGMSYEDRLRYEDAMSRRGDFVSAVEDTKNGRRSNETIFDKLGRGASLEPNPLYDKTLPNLIAGSVPVTIMGYADGVISNGPISVTSSVPSATKSTGVEKAENISDAAIAASSNNDDQNTVLLRSINQHLADIKLSSRSTSRGIVEVAKAEQIENAENAEQRHKDETEKRYASSKKKKDKKGDLLGNIWDTVKLLGMVAGALAIGKGLMDPDSVPGKMLNWGTKLIQWGWKTGNMLGGVPGAITGALAGIWMTKHPIKTAKGIAKGAKAIWNAPKNIKQGVRNTKAASKKFARSRNQGKGLFQSVKNIWSKPLRGANVPKLTKAPSGIKGAGGTVAKVASAMKGKKGKAALIAGGLAALGVGSYALSKNGDDKDAIQNGFGSFDDIDFDLDGTVPGSMPVSIVGIADDLNLGIGGGSGGGSGKPSGPVSVEKSQKAAKAYSDRTQKLQDLAYSEANRLAKEHEEATKYDNNLIWKGDKISTGLNLMEKATTVGLVTEGVKSLKQGGNFAKAAEFGKNAASAIKNAPANIAKGVVNAPANIAKGVSNAAKNTVDTVKNVKNIKDAANLAKGAGGATLKTLGKVAGPAMVALDVGMDAFDAAGRFKDAESVGEAFENGAVGKSAIAATKAASLAFPPAYLAAMAADAVLSKVDSVNENVAEAQNIMDAGSKAFIDSLNAAKEKSSKLPHMMQFADAVMNYDDRINEIGQYEEIARQKRAEADKDKERFWFNQDYAKQAALDNEASDAQTKATGVSLLHYGIGSSAKGRALQLELIKPDEKDPSTWKWIPKDKNAKKDFVLNAIERLKKEGYLEKDFHPTLQQKIDEITGIKGTVKHIYDGSARKPIYTDGMKPISGTRTVPANSTQITDKKSKTPDIENFEAASRTFVDAHYNNIWNKGPQTLGISNDGFNAEDYEAMSKGGEFKTKYLQTHPERSVNIQNAFNSARNDARNDYFRLEKEGYTIPQIEKFISDTHGEAGKSFVNLRQMAREKDKTKVVLDYDSLYQDTLNSRRKASDNIINTNSLPSTQIKMDMKRNEELKKINEYETQKKALQNVNSKIEETSKKQIQAATNINKITNNSLTNIHNTMSGNNSQQLDTFYPLPKTLTIGNIT